MFPKIPSCLLSACLALATSASAFASAVIDDDFGDGVLDSTTWAVLRPYTSSGASNGISQVTEADGVARFESLGTLVSAVDVPEAIDVTGRMRFTGSTVDVFWIKLRTDGSNANHPARALDNGVSFQINMGTEGNDVTLWIREFSYPVSNPQTLATHSMTIPFNTWTDFRITDDGQDVAFYIDDLVTPKLTASSNIRFGDRIGLHNREVNGAVVELDFLRVETVIEAIPPDPVFFEGFEQPDVASYPNSNGNWLLFGPTSSGRTGSSASRGTSFVGDSGNTWTVDSGNIDLVIEWEADEGNQSIDLNGFEAGSLFTEIELSRGIYGMAFSFSEHPALGDRTADMDVSVDGVSVPGAPFTADFPIVGGNMIYDRIEIPFAVSAAGLHAFRFTSLRQGTSDDSLGSVIDAFSIIPLEEAEASVLNGGFSQGNVGFESDYTASATVGLDAQYTVGTNPNDHHGSFASFGDHTSGDGLMFIANGTGGLVVWRQEVPVAFDQDYYIEFFAASIHDLSPANLELRIDGTAVGSTLNLGPSGDWRRYSALWNSGEGGTVTLEIVDVEPAGVGNDFALDDISMFAVPEPSLFKAVGIEFFAVTGRTYQVQVSEDMETWMDYGAPVTGDGAVHEVMARIPEDRKLFFRIQEM